MLISEPPLYHLLEHGSEERSQRVPSKMSKVHFQELQASMKPPKKGRKRHLSPCLGPHHVSAPLQMWTQFTKRQLWHIQALSKNTEIICFVGLRATIWYWGACTQQQVIPSSCFQLQYIRDKRMLKCRVFQKFKFCRTWNRDLQY